MIAQWQNGETVVGRLRITGAGVDPANAQLRLAMLLQNSMVPPASLPPGAIFFIRKLHDPLPRALRPDQHEIRPPSAWQQAFTTSLDRLLRAAARPARGAVPANAEAIVFLDRAELLAALADDWCAGRVAKRWWWRSLLRQGSAAQIVKELWRQTPEYIPAALDQLFKVNKAAQFVSTFTDGEAFSMLRAVARSFSLKALRPVLQALPASGSQPAALKLEKERAATTSKDRRDHPRTAQFHLPVAPWDHWVGKDPGSQLGPGQEMFLGISLMLQHAPSQVRSANFARELELWRRRLDQALDTRSKGLELNSERTYREPKGGAVQPTRNLKDVAGRPGPMTRHDRDSLQPSESLELDPVTSDNVSTASPVGDPRRTKSLPQKTPALVAGGAPPEPKEMGALAEEFSPRPASGHSSGFAFEAGPNAASFMPLALNDDLTESDSTLTDHDLPPMSLDQLSTRTQPQELRTTLPAFPNPAAEVESDEAQTQTQFGGVLYLINLALCLNLYGDFTTPDEPGIELNIWDFVALVGQELIGELPDDPLWLLLARLAQRGADQAPGKDFQPPDEWRLPPEWLEPFAGEHMVRCTTQDDRLRLLHAAEFLVLDVPLKTGPAQEQLKRELEAYEGFESRVSSLGEALVFEETGKTRYPRAETGNSNRKSRDWKLEKRNPKLKASPALDGWLDRLLPYVRARLRRAFGMNDAGDPASLLCRCPARIRATTTRVDVFIDLNDLPIEIRYAGLDRDPGWVPAAGRFIAFHFE